MAAASGGMLRPISAEAEIDDESWVKAGVPRITSI